MTTVDAFPETRVAPEDDPNRPKRSGRSLRERFEAFVSPEPMSGCFLWTGFAARSWGESGLGYGRFRLDGSRTDKTRNIIMQAHRVAIDRANARAEHIEKFKQSLNEAHLQKGKA